MTILSVSWLYFRTFLAADDPTCFLALRNGGRDLLAADDPTRLLAFWRGGQDLTPVCCDKDVVFDPYAADTVVFLEYIKVDVFRVLRGLEVDFFESVTGEIASLRACLAVYFQFAVPN